MHAFSIIRGGKLDLNQFAQRWSGAIAVIVLVLVVVTALNWDTVFNTIGKAIGEDSGEMLVKGRGIGGSGGGCSTLDGDGDGQTPCAGDCNDRDRSIFRGATEYCGNAVDEDCSGAADACVATVSIETTKNNYTSEEVELN